MDFLRNLFGKKQPTAVPESTKPTPPTSQSKQVQGILVLTLRPLNNAETLVAQIIDQQIARGHSLAPNFVPKARVGNFNDGAYVYATVRMEFSQFGGHDLMDRTVRFPFQASDGNSGCYYIVFDRP